MQLLKAIKLEQRLSFVLYSAWMAGLSIANKPTFKSIVPYRVSPSPLPELGFWIFFQLWGFERKLYYNFPQMTLASWGGCLGQCLGPYNH